METYEVAQAFMQVGTVYEVKKPGSDEVLYVVRGEFMSATPKFHMVEGKEGPEKGLLQGDLLKTKYEISAGGKTLATINFPAVAVKNKLTLHLDGIEYPADGGFFKDVFQCKGKDGDLVLEITKANSLKDKFTVKFDEKVPLPVAFLSSVAIHSRFFDVL